jgi:hypothetical protein
MDQRIMSRTVVAFGATFSAGASRGTMTMELYRSERNSPADCARPASRRAARGEECPDYRLRTGLAVEDRNMTAPFEQHELASGKLVVKPLRL